MRKTLMLLGAVMLLATGLSTTAHAQHAGQWGLGLLDTSFPVGVFYGINDQTVLHAGLGFNKFDVAENSGDLETQFGILVALSWDFVQGSGWGFGIIPNFAFTSRSPEGSGDGDSFTHIGIDLGGHWDPVDAVSLWFRHGLSIDIYSPPQGDSSTDFGTSGIDLGSFGATFYIT